MEDKELFQNICRLLSDRYWIMITRLPNYHATKVFKVWKTWNENYREWPVDKTSRWLGYLQCMLIEVHELTTVDEERNYTRPLFHLHYNVTGQKIPKSVET